MVGAFIGDTIGSAYEGITLKRKEFEFFSPYTHPTDDSIMTLAIEEALMKNYPFRFDEEGIAKLKKDTVESMVLWFKMYPKAGYGCNFEDWCRSEEHRPYNSCGNGSAMRISPVSYLANSIEEVKILSKAVSEVTHNHQEGIKGAESLAVSIFLARQGKSKEEIRDYVINNYYPELKDMSYKKLIEHYEVSVLCQRTVPEAIVCFLDSSDFQDALL